MLKAPPMEILKPQSKSSCSCPSFKERVNCAFDLQYQYFTIIQGTWTNTYMQICSCDLLGLRKMESFQKTTE